jgi:hypothetical protein
VSELTNKQAACCREYVIDCNATAAAKRAGYAENSANETAAKMMKLPHVAEEIQRMQADLARSANVTVASLLQKAELAWQIAVRTKQIGSASALLTFMAKMCGLMVERHEDVVKRDELERQSAQRGALVEAGALLADAAQSLGLPRTATPAQIVGAVAERPVATPEVFRLMHEAAKEST